MVPIFVLTTRGLEDVSAAELRGLAVVGQESYRRIAARVAGELAPLLALRTVDDLFVDVATWNGIARPRAVLAILTESAGRLDLRSAVESIGTVRRLPTPPSFTVTASFVGKRNYTGDEIRAAVASGIARRSGWTHRDTDVDADLNVRVFIEHEIAYVGVRVAARPLHERSYKSVHRPGSLKASVAAAMLALVEARPGMRLLDPCCGTGTIAIEAALAGTSAIAGDLDAGAVAATQANARDARLALACARWDALALPLTDHSFDRVVCNLPWDRQVAVADSLRAFNERAGPAIARCVAARGRIAVLTADPEALAFPGFTRVAAREISLYGQRPVIALYA